MMTWRRDVELASATASRGGFVVDGHVVTWRLRGSLLSLFSLSLSLFTWRCLQLAGSAVVTESVSRRLHSAQQLAGDRVGLTTVTRRPHLRRSQLTGSTVQDRRQRPN